MIGQLLTGKNINTHQNFGKGEDSYQYGNEVEASGQCEIAEGKANIPRHGVKTHHAEGNSDCTGQQALEDIFTGNGDNAGHAHEDEGKHFNGAELYGYSRKLRSAEDKNEAGQRAAYHGTDGGPAYGFFGFTLESHGESVETCGRRLWCPRCVLISIAEIQPP